MAKQTAIRGNQTPPGGITQTANVQQAQPLIADTFTLLQLSENFMNRSEQNCIQLNDVTLTPGQTTNFIVQNVGLGESLELMISGSINIQNTAATAATIQVSPEFPFNLISNLLVQFNGQTVLHSLSGYELLGIMAKRSKGMFIGARTSAGAVFSQNNTQIPNVFASLGITNGTVIAGTGLTGVSSITVNATSTGVLTFRMYVNLPFTLRQDLLLGMIPMQNNSVYCNVSITMPALSLQATTPIVPLHGAPATANVISTVITAKPTYNFWSIPVPNDATLYAYLVSYNYMLLSQVANNLPRTGVEAMQYNLGNNFFLLSLLATIRNAGNVLVDVPLAIENPHINYNGTIRVDRRDIHTRNARQTMHYETIASPLGQLLWDATDVHYEPNSTNTTKWLNMYLANNPQFIADIQEAVTVPGSFSVLREQLVPANVQLL